MSDPEPPSYEKALHQIRSTFSTARLEAQGEYLRKYSSHYTRDEIDKLFSTIEAQLMRLNPEPTEYNCSRIASIEVIYTPEGNGYSITPQSKTHNLMKYCTLAYEANKRLSEYITDLEELGGGRIYDLRYEFQRPTAAIEGLRAEEEEVEFERREVEARPTREKEVGLGIDVMDIFNRLQRQIDERFEELRNQLRSGASPAQTDTLRERIDDLERQRDRMESEYRELQGKVEKEQKTRVFQKTLTAKEYRVFQNNYEEYLPGLKPYTFHKAGEGYSVRIEYENAEQYNAINELMKLVQREGRPSERKVNPVSVSPMVDTFCGIFESETGNKCGISRYGALTTLAEMINNYIATYNEKHPGRHELDIQAIQKYIDEIDLFAKKGQEVYSTEQAQEAFGVLVRNIERSQMSEEQLQSSQAVSMETEFDVCVPHIMYPEFVDIYVYLEKKAKGNATEQDKRGYERALQDLKPCNYSAERYNEFVEGAVEYFESIGQDFYEITDQLIGE